MWTQPMTETPRITILKNNSQIKKNKARNMKYVVIVWKPIPFFEDWSWDFKENGVFFLETRWVWERFNRGRQWIVTKVRVKTQNKFLKLSLKQKTRVFCDSISPELLRKKTFLSVFHDWKFYSWESCIISRENLWVPLWLEPPPVNKSPI